MQTQVLVMGNSYCLALIVEGGSLLLLDPLSLQPFKAMQLSAYHQVDTFIFQSNILWTYGRRHLLIVELDYELKKQKSIFIGRSGIYEKHRQSII